MKHLMLILLMVSLSSITINSIIIFMFDVTVPNLNMYLVTVLGTLGFNALVLVMGAIQWIGGKINE